MHDPATGAQLAIVSNVDDSDAQDAIAEAEKAFLPWHRLRAKNRSNLLRRWYELLMANKDDLACLMTAEQGKPLEEAKGEVASGASFVEWFA